MRKVYIFGTDSQGNEKWYCDECNLGRPRVFFNKRFPFIHIIMFADTEHFIGRFYVLTPFKLIKMIAKKRIFFNKKKAQEKQLRQWRQQCVTGSEMPTLTDKK